MSFVSLQFCGLMVLSLLVYYLFSKILPRFQWVVLLAASYVFYMWSVPSFVFFLLFSTLTTWIFPLLIGKVGEAAERSASRKELTREERKTVQGRKMRKQRLLLVLCLLCNIGLLVFLKYTNFLIEIFQLIGLEMEPLSWLVLPLGISFYTFQSAGYCIDVYRGTAEPEHNFFRYALYVSFFPQISQGPIGRYKELSPQLYVHHKFCYEEFTAGLERMLLGFFKKLFVADQIGLFVDMVYGAPASYSGLMLAFATLLYAFQLYADFSGYMDIALGIGRCFGIRLSENFETPYFSKSIPEFWRRWHITLGSWFRDYLYYSLMRSRFLSGIMKELTHSGHKRAAKNIPTAIALFVTWTVIGFWHGAAWNFIAHGLFHGTFVILSAVLSKEYKQCREKLHIREESRLWKGFQIVRTFAIVNVGYVLFRSESLKLALYTYKRIATAFFEGGFTGFLTGQFTVPYWIMILISLLVCALLEFQETRKPFAEWVTAKPLPVRWSILYGMILSVLYILLFTNMQAAGAGNFLYFNF